MTLHIQTGFQDLFPPESFQATDFQFKIARASSEQDGFWHLRQQVFCQEQRIFSGSDRDEYDDTMIPIVCNSMIMGMADDVVGAVRIDAREPGIWWGSRLCVASQFRRKSKFSASVAKRNQLPPLWRSIGGGLIYAAVTTAAARGCTEFLATVQKPNARFFSMLHWDLVEELDLFGRPHVKMRADLAFYPPNSSYDAL
jgi:hypothetical protein